MKFIIISIAISLAMSFSGAILAQNEGEWEEFTYGEQPENEADDDQVHEVMRRLGLDTTAVKTYYRMPYEVMREIGFDPPDLPDDQNAALYIYRANMLVKSEDMDYEDFRYVMEHPWSREEYPKAVEWIEANEPALELLGKALALEHCYFPVLTESPGDTSLINTFPLLHTADTRSLARILTVRANLHIAEDRMDEAIDDALDMLRLGSYWAKNKVDMAGLLGSAICHMGLSSLRKTLAAHELPPEQLAEIQEKLDAERHRLPNFAEELRTELFTGRRSVELFIDGDLLLMAHEQTYGGEAPEALREFVGGRMWRKLFPDRSMTKQADWFYDKLIDLAERQPWEIDPDEFKAIAEGAEIYNIAAARYLGMAGYYVNSFGNLRAEYEATIQAIAIMRYHADHDGYPDELDALVPDYLPELPVDPFTGESFLYRSEDGGFLVYSLGENRIDDGGVSQFEEYEARDVVVKFGVE